MVKSATEQEKAAMSVPFSPPLKVGRWLVDPSTGVLSSNGAQVTLRPREMELLVYLARHANSVVTGEELLANVWSGVVVGTDSVYFSISQLRKALGDDSNAPEFLETIPKRGYRLIAPVDYPEPETPRRRTRLLAGVFGALLLAGLITAMLVRSGNETEPVVPANSIAVMPFVDLSPNNDQAYFSDGIAEELLNHLARMPGLNVAARTSSFSFKKKEAGIREIGRSLGVATVLEGSVRRDGDQVRIAAQLIDADSGFQRWSETYELPMSSIFAAQDQISRSIVAALEPELLGRSPPAVPLRSTDPLAYDLYLQGAQGVRVNSYEALRMAAERFTRATEIDPTFAEAFAALAHTRQVLFLTGADPNPASLAVAEQLAHQAIEIDSDTPRAYQVLGSLAERARDPERAIGYYRTALERAPGNSDVIASLASLLTFAGERNEAFALFQRALRSDPFNPKVQSAYAMYQTAMGDDTGALTTLERAAAQSPENPNIRWRIGNQHLNLGDVAAAIDSFSHAAELDPLDHDIAAHLAMAYASVGLLERANEWIDRATTLGPDNIRVRAAQAIVLFTMGNNDAGLEVARRSLQNPDLRGLHKPHDLLRSLAVNELVSRGRYDDAEMLLAADEALTRYLDGPAATRYSDLYQMHVAPTSLLALANVYKRQGRKDDMETVLEYVAVAGLAGTAEFRDSHRAEDHLVEAQIQALRGNATAACEQLTLAADLGFRLNWQLQLAANDVFADMLSERRFLAVLERLSRDNIAQQRRLLS